MKNKHIKALLILIVLNATIGLQLYAQHDLYGIWAKRAAFGSSGAANIITSTIDDDKNVFVTGYFSGNLNFSDDICDAKILQASTARAGSGFISKYDEGGKYQWSIISSPTKTSTDNTNTTVSSILDYKNGKLLVLVKVVYQSSTAKPLEIVVDGPVNDKTLSKPTVDGSGLGGIVQIAAFLQIIDCETGELEQTIDAFITGTHNVYAKFANNNKVHILHWGSGSLYSSLRSRYSIYDLTTNSITASAIYPNQPVIGGTIDTRVRGGVTLPNGDNCIHQMPHEWPTSSKAWTTSYIMMYSNDMATYKSQLIVDTNAEVVVNELATDGGSNIYFMSHYGNKKYATNQTTTGKNTLTSFLGSTKTFQTKDGYRKLIVSKLKPDLTCDWLFQIGGNSIANDDVTSGHSIKVKGNYVYVSGQFSGSNVNFDPIGNNANHVLSSNGGLDGFYAIYDNSNGNCVYAVNIGGTKDDNITTISMAGDNIVLGGTYVSPKFQTDPAEQLYELSNSGATQQGFITLYSNIAQSPISVKSSFGDAPESYGLAVHHASECLRIGKMDLAKIQGTPVHSIKADVAENDDGLKIAVDANGYADLKNGDLQLDAGGDLTAVVKVHNNTLDDAKIIGWFDFNENGVFDGASEASTIVVVQKNTIAASATVKLRWVGASTKLRNGQTYMRLRITSDNIDATQPQGLFFNGEAEDYGVKLKLLSLDKTVLDKNMLNISEANVGDTITYVINPLTTVVVTNIKLFDPIPEYTKFVDADNGVMPTNVTINGETYPAVVWNIPSLPPTATPSYSFRVVVTGKPKLSDSIYNIAFATMNGDTVNSAQATCNINGVKVNKLVAQNDYYVVLAGDSIMAAPISLNDTDHERNFVRDTILKVYEGTAEMNEPRNGTLKYVSKPNFVGVDSIDYRIKTANDSADAKVYIVVVKPLSHKYIACPDAKITLGVATIPGVTYNWYTAAIGGVPVKTNSNTHQVIKNDVDFIETWYVETTYNGVVFPRFPINLFMSDNCGVVNPTDCAVEGTVIWNEDFDSYNDGLNPFSPKYSQVPLIAGMTTYNFMRYQGTFPSTGMYAPGSYAIVKDALDPDRTDSWLRLFRDDHTYPSDNEKGRFFVANGRNVKDQLYKQQIDGLCDSISSLYFSFWARGYHAELTWTIYSSDTDEVLSVLSLPPMLDSSLVNKELTWQHYGFKFDIPTGVSSIYFDIYNNCDLATGNDFALDDIEVRLCAPPVTINTPMADTVLCPGRSLHFEGDYTDNPIAFGNNLKARWQFSKTGNINVESEWSNIGSVSTSSTGSIGATYDITNMSKADDGYYRIIVGTPASINRPNCRVMSKPIRVSLNDSPSAYPEVRVQACPGNGLLNLSKYIDTTDFKSVTWSTISGPAIGATTGIVNSNDFVTPFTYAYNFKVKNTCYEPESKLYVRTIRDKVFNLPPDTIVVCCTDKSAAHLNLNIIVGIEANVSWLYDNTVNHDGMVSSNTHLSVAPAVYAGSYTFNAAKAWYEASAAYLVPGGHNGDLNAKMFKFRYTTTAASCIGASTKEMVIIVTEKITF